MILPGAPSPTPPVASQPNPPADPLMGSPMQTPQMQPGVYGTPPGYGAAQQRPRTSNASKKTSSKKNIIVWSSVGGTLLVLVVVLCFVFLSGGGGAGIPVPEYLKKVEPTDAEKVLYSGMGGKVLAYECQNKTTAELIDWFESNLPNKGWKGGIAEAPHTRGRPGPKEMMFLKSNETLMINISQDGQKLRVVIGLPKI